MKKQIENGNLRDQIYDIIHDMIITRTILPGEKILEEDLAKSIGVSRTPVRECLCRLQNEGIVEIIPRRGAFLSKYSKKKVTEVFEMREMLEGLVARLAASNREMDFVEPIKNLLGRVYGLPDHGSNFTEFTRADIEFHQMLLNACNNDMLKSAMAVINTHLKIIRARTVTIPGRARRTVEEHYGILEAVKQKNPQIAEDRMRNHIVSVRDHAFSSLDFSS